MHRSLVNVRAWLKNSFIDFPGTVSTVLFFWGCNLRCPYCHNVDLVTGEAVADFTPEDIVVFLEKRRRQIEGVVFSGGEPTIREELPLLAKEIRSLGYRIKLDSNGLLPDQIRSVAPDYLALDLKCLPAQYSTLLKAPFNDVPDRLNKSLEIVRFMGESAEVRITVAPGLMNLGAIEQMAALLQGVNRVFLQPMNQNMLLLDPDFNIAPPVPAKTIEQFRDTLSEVVGTCIIRGK